MESEENENIIEIKKAEAFKKEVSNLKLFTQKINEMYETEFNEAFKQILILSKEEFMSFITNGIETLLIERYGVDVLENQKLKNIQNKNITLIEKNYENHYHKINNVWNNFSTLKKNNDKNINKYYLTNFRKHCCDTDNIAFHNCKNEPNSKFIIVEENRNIKYVICIECKMVYFSNFILCHCSQCNIDYYSSILSKEENPNLLIATWKKYHCNKLINEKMKCIKCKGDFYINLETRMLNCLNKKCNFITKPSRVLWTCTICKEDFKSDAIIYNPLQYEYLKQIIKQTLMIRQRAHPRRMPCCKLNIFCTEFFHKKECKGILYSGEIEHNIIIVCEKCKAINFDDRFIWTCPKCGLRFRDKNLIRKKTFSHMYQNRPFHSMSFNIQSERSPFQSRKSSQNDSEKTKAESQVKDRKKRTKTNLFDILERRRKNSESISRNNHQYVTSERRDIREDKFINNCQKILDERNSSPPKHKNFLRKLNNMKEDNLLDIVKKRNDKSENIKPIIIGRNERNNIEKNERLHSESNLMSNESRNKKQIKLIKDNESIKNYNEDEYKDIKYYSRRDEKFKILREEKEKKDKEEKEKKEKEKKERRERREKERQEKKEKEEKEKKEKEEKEKKEKEEFEKKIQEQKLLKMKLLKEQEEFERKEHEYKEKLKLEKEQKLRLENEEKQKQKYLMEIKMKKELLKKQLMEKDSKKYFNYISRSIEGNNYHKNLKLDDNSSSLDKNFIIYKSQFQSKKIKLPNLKNSYELPPINHINLGINHNRIQLSNNNFDNIHNNRRYKLSSNNSINQLFKINGQKSPIRFQPFNIDKRLINNNFGYRNNLNLYNNYNGYKLTKDVYLNPNFKKKLIPIKKIF